VHKHKNRIYPQKTQISKMNSYTFTRVGEAVVISQTEPASVRVYQCGKFNIVPHHTDADKVSITQAMSSDESGYDLVVPYAQVLSPATADRNELIQALGTLFAQSSPTGAEIGAVSVNNFPATQVVSGDVNVSNLPAIQPVSGAVTVSNLPSTQQIAGSVSVSNLPSTQPISGSVSVSNLPATQQIAGTVGVNNFPSTQQVGGTVKRDWSAVGEGIRTNPTVSNASSIVLAANANRSGVMITNTATGTVFLTFGGASSTTNYSIALSAGAYLELPEWACKSSIQAIKTGATQNIQITTF
jgi:hypothetical protein